MMGKEKILYRHLNSNGTESVVSTARSMNFVYIALSLAGVLAGISLFASPPPSCEDVYKSQIEFVKESNKKIAQECSKNYSDDIEKLNDCTSNPLPMPKPFCDSGSGSGSEDKKKVVKHQQTLRAKFGLEYCRYTNGNHYLPKQDIRWFGYDIACEKGVAFEPLTPEGEWTVFKTGYGNNLGDYVVIKNGYIYIVLAHIKSYHGVGSKITNKQPIGKTVNNGATTGMHLHIEVWKGDRNMTSEFMINGVEEVAADSKKLLKFRQWDFPAEGNKYFFTRYDLGDKSQNDSSPCVGASGKDLCSSGIKSMALTRDIRDGLGIKFGDKVKLVADDGTTYTYQVEDEMNCRFRGSPCYYYKNNKKVFHPTGQVYNSLYPIKGDLTDGVTGVFSIYKL